MTMIATHRPMQPLTAQVRPTPAQPALPHRTTWTERLAAWAERQPDHRRLGCWTVG